MNLLDPAAESRLSGKVAVVTGAGSGIGAAIARQFAALGATVVLCGRRLEVLETAAALIHSTGGEAYPIQCDVSHLESVGALATEVARRFERVDILVNNAGVGGSSRKLHEVDPEEWDRIFNTNLRGVFYCMRAFTPLMLVTGGDIINISSVVGRNPLPNGAAYAASKWGLNGLSYSAAEELREQGIRVSVVCPASTETDFSPHSGKDAAKMLQPEDVAHVVAMLVTQAPRSFVSDIVLRPIRKP